MLVKRVLPVILAAAVVAAGAAYALRSEEDEGPRPEARSIEEMASEVGAQVVTNLKRGHVRERSGDMILVPKPHNYLIGQWDYTTLGTETPWLNTSHPNPWDFIARVPIIVWGPGIESGVEIWDETDIASIPATYAEILGMEDFPAEAPPLPGLSNPEEPPSVIVTVVIDGGGWNTLEEHPQSWPTLARLRAEGTTYTNATIGSAPSITGALHATVGTGSYPVTHGIPGNVMRSPEDGEIVDVYLKDSDPRFLESEAVAEAWRAANDDAPIVATVSYEGWHLGMIGAGAAREGGYPDIAVIWDVENGAWTINEDFYTLPDYLVPTDVAALERYEEAMDERDGMLDGTWFGHTLEELREKRVRPSTPAYARLTGDAVVDILRNEPWGNDDLTDFFWIEMKAPDTAGHMFNVTRPEVGDTLYETDAQIARFMEVLDEEVGEGEYLLVVTADHGQQPLADGVGGWRISMNEVHSDLVAEFGEVVEKVTTADLYLDTEAMERENVSFEDIADFISRYTIGDSIPEDAPGGDRVPPARLSETVFAGAFPGDYLMGLTEADIGALGEGSYPESRLTIEPPP